MNFEKNSWVAKMKFFITIIALILMLDCYAQLNQVDKITAENTYMIAYQEVDKETQEQDCYISIGNKRLKLIIYPENLRSEDSPLYVIYLDDLTVDNAYITVDQNQTIRINGILFNEKRRYTLHEQLKIGNMVNIRTFDVKQQVVDVNVALKGYTRLSKKIESVCSKNIQP